MARKQRDNGRLNVAPSGGSFSTTYGSDQKNGDVINPPRFIKGFSGGSAAQKRQNDLNVKHVGK